jgi:hypothetical protein
MEVKFGELKLKLPKKMKYKTKKGKEQEIEPITKTGQLKTRQGKKSVKIELKGKK